MKNKENLLAKLEKIVAPVMIASETHAITLVVLVLGVVSFIPVNLWVPTFVRMFVNEGILLFIGGLVYVHHPTKASKMGDLLLR